MAGHGSSGGSYGSSGGSLVATPDCKPAVPGSNQQSPQPTVDCQSLDGLPSGMVLHCRLSSEGRQKRINTKKGQQIIAKKHRTPSTKKICGRPVEKEKKAAFMEELYTGKRTVDMKQV